MASHLLPLTLSVTVVIDVRHAYIITLPALFINPSDYLTVTKYCKNARKSEEMRNRQILRRIDRHERIVVGRTGKSREVPLLLLWGQER